MLICTYVYSFNHAHQCSLYPTHIHCMYVVRCRTVPGRAEADVIIYTDTVWRPYNMLSRKRKREWTHPIASPRFNFFDFYVCIDVLLFLMCNFLVQKPIFLTVCNELPIVRVSIDTTSLNAVHFSPVTHYWCYARTVIMNIP